MLHRHLAAAASAALLLAFVPQPAYAATGPGEGSRCGFTSVLNPFTDDDRQVAEVDAGPLLINDGADPRAGRITCTFREGTSTHVGGTTLATVSSLTTPGLVFLQPTLVEYVASPETWFTFCSQVDIEGVGTFYWDDDNNVWSTDPNVTCWNLLPDPPPGPDLVQLILDAVNQFFVQAVDPVVCPLLAALSPGVEPLVTITPEGDTYVAGTFIWDCPPYQVP